MNIGFLRSPHFAGYTLTSQDVTKQLGTAMDGRRVVSLQRRSYSSPVVNDIRSYQHMTKMASSFFGFFKDLLMLLYSAIGLESAWQYSTTDHGRALSYTCSKLYDLLGSRGQSGEP